MSRWVVQKWSENQIPKAPIIFYANTNVVAALKNLIEVFVGPKGFSASPGLGQRTTCSGPIAGGTPSTWLPPDASRNIS